MGMTHPGSTVPARAGTAHRISIADLKRSLFARRRRWACTIVILLVIVLGLCCIEIMMGNTVYSPGTIGAVLAGADIEGATYAVWGVRLPRLLAGSLVGFAFGIAGNTFQTMLRNPLASPDVIGITSGASVTAVFCILIVGMGASEAAPGAIAGGVATAALIFALSSIDGFSIGKFVLVGLGVQAFMKAVTSYLLLRGAEFDVPTALRWLNGSLSGTTMEEVAGLLAIVPLCALVVLFARQLRVLELGDTSAVMLGARPALVRGVLVICTVATIACGTAVTGPIACVTFLSGPIAARLVGQNSSATIPAGLVGATLVLAADLVGQYVLGTRFPVGVVTGILGTPYLLYLLVRMNKKGAL